MNNNILKNMLISNQKFNSQKEYWQNKLSRDVVFGSIPYDHYRGDGTVGRRSFAVSKQAYEKLLDMSKSSTYGVFSIMACTVFYILYKYTGSSSSVIGMPIFRQTAEGIFANEVLALKAHMEDGMMFKDFMQAMWEEIKESGCNMAYPIDTVITALKQSRDMDEPKGFGIMVEFASLHHKLAGIRGMCKMLFSFEICGNELIFHIEYRSGLYKDSTIERLGSYFNHVLDQVAENPSIGLCDIEMLTPEEKHRLLYEFNNTHHDYPCHSTINSLFEEQAAKTPDKTAIFYKEHTITYGELSRQSNRYARQLADMSVKKDSSVLIRMNRSIDLFIAVIAVLKAGGVCIPVSMDCPTARVNSILKESGSKLVIQSSPEPCGYEFDGTCMVYDTKNFEAYDDNSFNNDETTADSSAYIIFTSGSTGRPKGVVLSHRGIINHAYTKIYELGFMSDEKLYFKLSISFVASIWQLYSPLFIGASVVISPEELASNPYEVFRDAQQHGVAIIETVPSFLGAYLTIMKTGKEALSLASVRKMVVTGEKVDPVIVNEFYSHYHIDMVNAYGQSECSDDTVHYNIPYSTDTQSVYIGKPARNTRVYVLNDFRSLLPEGIPGELYISGDGLAKGYLNDEGLTRERFVPNPYELGVLMYKTGDIVRWMPDGNIECIGRKDRQIKIRGFRVELEEIESCILKYDLVDEAAVVCKQAGDSGSYIMAFIVSKSGQSVLGLRRYLESQLPGYMVPSKILKLDKLPLNTSGKIDRKALGNYETSGSKEYLAPQNDLERKMADTWRDILGCEAVGVNCNLFDKGANSLNMAIFKIHMEKYGIDIEITDIQKHPIISELAAYVSNGESRPTENTCSQTCKIAKDVQTVSAVHADDICIQGIEPFNDIFYKNCFYNSLFPLIKRFQADILPVLINDSIVYCYDDGDAELVEYRPQKGVEELVAGMNIGVVSKRHVNDIAGELYGSLSRGMPVILWVDTFHIKERVSDYMKNHYPHTMLIFGCDKAGDVFDVIDNTSREGFNYKKLKIPRKQLEDAFHGFVNNFLKSSNTSDVFFSFRPGAMNTTVVKQKDSQRLKEYRQAYLGSINNSHVLLMKGLEDLKSFNAFYEEAIKTGDAFKQKINSLIQFINSAINGRKIEEYRVRQLFGQKKSLVNIIETVVDQWTGIRIMLMKAELDRYDIDYLMLCSKRIQHIIKLEHLFYEMIEIHSNTGD